MRRTDENRTEWSQTIRAKHLMDNATTLADAAAKLRKTAEYLEQMETDGWQLTEPVTDDYGFIERSARTDDRLTEAEIVQIRKRWGLSREKFAKLTGIGEASLARWEGGYLVQNAAMDNYLRLLDHQENIQRLLTKQQEK